MGVEPTLDQEAGRATVLKTANPVGSHGHHTASLRRDPTNKRPAACSNTRYSPCPVDATVSVQPVSSSIPSSICAANPVATRSPLASTCRSAYVPRVGERCTYSTRLLRSTTQYSLTPPLA